MSLCQWNECKTNPLQADLVDGDRSASDVDKTILANVCAAYGGGLADALKGNAEDRDLLAVEADVASQVVEAEKTCEGLLLAFVVDDLATAFGLAYGALTVVVVLARRRGTRTRTLTTTIERRCALGHGFVLLRCVTLDEVLEQILVGNGNRDPASSAAKQCSGVETVPLVRKVFGGSRQGIDVVCLVSGVGLVQNLLNGVDRGLQRFVLLYIQRSAGVRARRVNFCPLTTWDRAAATAWTGTTWLSLSMASPRLVAC